MRFTQFVRHLGQIRIASFHIEYAIYTVGQPVSKAQVTVIWMKIYPWNIQTISRNKTQLRLALQTYGMYQKQFITKYFLSVTFLWFSHTGLIWNGTGFKSLSETITDGISITTSTTSFLVWARSFHTSRRLKQ